MTAAAVMAAVPGEASTSLYLFACAEHAMSAPPDPERDATAATRALLLLIGTMQQREERLRDIINAQLQLLQAGVQRAGGDVGRVVESALPRLTQLSQQALASTLDPASKQFEHALQRANKTLQAATDDYAQAQKGLALKASRGMTLATAALGLAALIAAASAVYLLHNARQEVVRLQPQRTYYEAIGQADWVACGDGRLCARVETKGARYGQGGQYRRIELRR